MTGLNSITIAFYDRLNQRSIVLLQANSLYIDKLTRCLTPQMDILIYTPNISARIEYTIQFVFERLLGLEVALTSQKDEWKHSTENRLNYSSEAIGTTAFFIPAHPILTSEGIQPQSIEVHHDLLYPYFFTRSNPEADLPFDLFAMTFYLLSRYEEYLPFEADQFGRFTASQSLAFQEQFLRMPLIDLWVKELQKLLTEQFPDLIFSNPAYRFLPTYDIDYAWAFLHKGFLRTLGAYGRDLIQLNFPSIADRLKCQSQLQQDPFYKFDFLDELHEGTGLTPIYFFLLGDFAKYDKNIAHDIPAFQTLINEVATQYTVGIHPSFQSNEAPERIAMEQERLAKITGQSIVNSRQHFLRLQLPDTYLRLINTGIRQDYSMGYAADIGFRAGTAHDFPWFDLKSNAATELQVFPFQVMDVTLKQYLKYEPKQAFEEVLSVIQYCRQVGGRFCTLWHNSSFAEKDGWTAEWIKLYLEIFRTAFPANRIADGTEIE